MVRLLVQIFALEVLQLMQEAIIHVEGHMRVLSPPQGSERQQHEEGGWR